MKRKKRISFSYYLKTYVIYFLVIAFLISCCMILFLKSMMNSMNIQFTRDNIAFAAELTMANVIFLSIVFTIIDIIRRRYMVERPVNRIVEATKKVSNGDFTVQIPAVPVLDNNDGFNEIIDNINLMVKELSGTETLRTDFISNVSHELKTPLSVIQNYGKMLQASNLTEEERLEYAKAITQSTGKLADLISNILRLNKLENQQIRPQGKQYNLSEQICESLLNFEELWVEKEIEIVTEIEDDVQVVADKELLALVWNNLLSNAMKFTERNGKIEVSLKVLDEDNSVIVSISDNGCGMDEDTGRHIFEKFYQGDTSHTTQGNGLGLALVKRIIDITENDIAVRSQLGKGTTFIVKLHNKV